MYNVYREVRDASFMHKIFEKENTMSKFMIAVLLLVLVTPATAGELGAAVGTVGGIVLGAQVKGKSKPIAVIVGASAGAVIGSVVEEKMSKGAGDGYVCVANCKETQTAQYGSAGEEAAAHRGAADRRVTEQAVAEQTAYCSQNPSGCTSRRGYNNNRYPGNHRYGGGYKPLIPGNNYGGGGERVSIVLR